MIMQTQTKLCLCFIKININFFSHTPKLPLISKVRHSPSIKKPFLDCQDEMISTPNIITFLAKSLSKLHSLFPSNALMLFFHHNR